MINKLKQLIQEGEGLSVEFKRCKNEFPLTAYKAVSSFSNRYGGYILLGVEDGGIVVGVNPDAVDRIKKDFATSLNNPERFSPTLFLALEKAEIDGKIVLWCYIPPNSQVVIFNGRIYDRVEDSNIDITRNSEMVSQIHMRKKADYTERCVFPYAKDADFDFARLMPKARMMAVNRLPTHPWKNMSDKEIIKSAGLYSHDRKTGETGYNLAAVLLFGLDDVIRSCTANYVTDAICRRDDLKRYDDRLMVTTNLIDAFDQLMDFIAKHTLDRFFLIGNQSVSVRSKIARELVSNILMHREYSSAYPAKIIIEKDRIVTENWSLPRTPGRIDPNNFTPYPKNPVLANFFINIGYADMLGSGLRNLYEYTSIYTGGGEPELIDGDVFRAIVPLSLSGTGISGNKTKIEKQEENSEISGKMSDNAMMSDKMSDNAMVSDKVSDSLVMSDNAHHQAILAYLHEHGEINAATAAAIIIRSPATARRVLSQLAHAGLIEAIGANRNRKYRKCG